MFARVTAHAMLLINNNIHNINRQTAAHHTCSTKYLLSFRLGEVGSHVAALLFKMEITVKMGLTKTSSTSEACKWNASFRKQLEPLTLQEMAETGLLRGNRKRPVASSYPLDRATC